MEENTFYPVFEADQVLTADHLNEIVNYLDDQERLTRNKLIGIGIACGLELKVSSSQINISKGCGVTSEGYLIELENRNCTYYRPYELPSDFFAKHKPVYENREMFELLTAEESLKFDDTELLKDSKNFLRDKIVVLLLEMKEIQLKNCTETDCDDKGSKINFAVKPLLVNKKDIREFLKSISNDDAKTGKTDSEMHPQLHDIRLRRFNVPVKDLKTADDVFNAFLELTDDNTLKKLAEILNYSYVQYRPLLNEETINPFTSVLKTFKDKLEFIKKSNPYFIQYFYDWIDDIIKGYYEFKGRVFYVQTMCCPPENIFPLHLMLGEATKDTSIEFRSAYRNYFIYSPLFNDQKDLHLEIQILFRKMKILVQNFDIKDTDEFEKTQIKITPSRYLDKQLSERCIPYHYDPEGLYQCWSWSKTQKGNARFNLSYNSDKYSSSDSVLNPLLYDIEWYNFFRIEGHIGKSVSAAIRNILGQRNSFNLPFEVTALSTATISKFSSGKDDECNFKDLESLYNVLKSELICKTADASCFSAGIKFTLIRTVGFASGFGGDNPEAGETEFSLLRSEFLNKNISLVASLGLSNTLRKSYQKGDFLRSHCKISKGTIGEVYLRSIKRGSTFSKPDSDANFGSGNTVYAHMFYFIDCVENLMSAMLPLTLDEFNINNFKSRYDLLMNELRVLISNEAEMTRVLKLNFRSFIEQIKVLQHLCIDDRLEALKNEFIKRKNEITALKNLMNYFRKHPGMEHKAGVPKGGTFILVYNEIQSKRLTFDFQRGIASLFKDIPGINFEKINLAQNIIDIDFLKNAEVKDKTLTLQFYSALSKYIDICKDMDEETKEEITNILVRDPKLPARAERFRVTDLSVIADFYLPYMCCSDCSPIAYVLPKDPPEVLRLSIEKTDFCNNDDSSYNVSVSPQGGKLTASGGGAVSEQGRFFFRPFGLPAGNNKLTYKIEDGRSTSVDLKISEPIKIDFKHKVQDDGVTVEFISKTTYPNYEWDFGDGSDLSTETSPRHTYSFDDDEKTFSVTLTVDNSPCSSVKTRQIRLRRPDPVEFDIEPRVFCSNDKKKYEFTTSPTAKDSDIENENGLVIGKNSLNKKLFLVPLKQQLTESKEFHLSYKEVELDLRIIVADAGFMMKIDRDSDDDFILTLKAKNSDADKYDWKLTQGRITLKSTERAFRFSYNQQRLTAGNDLTIVLNISYDLNGTDCKDSKRYVLTEEVFFKHVNGIEFDNNTTD